MKLKEKNQNCYSNDHYVLSKVGQKFTSHHTPNWNTQRWTRQGPGPPGANSPIRERGGKEIAKTQLKNAVLLVEVFWDFKLKIFISLCSWRRLKFTLLVRIFAVFLRGRYPKLLELWQEGLDILGFNSLMERSVLLKSQALGMRRDSPLSKGNFECSAVSVNFCHTLSCLAGLLISVVPCTILASSK